MSAEYYGELHKYQLQQRWYTEYYRRSVRTGIMQHFEHREDNTDMITSR